MHRMEARKIAKIAYKEISEVIKKWTEGPIDWLPIDFHWEGNVTVGDQFFCEMELIEYDGE